MLTHIWKEWTNVFNYAKNSTKYFFSFFKCSCAYNCILILICDNKIENKYVCNKWKNNWKRTKEQIKKLWKFLKKEGLNKYHKSTRKK